MALKQMQRSADGAITTTVGGVIRQYQEGTPDISALSLSARVSLSVRKHCLHWKSALKFVSSAAEALNQLQCPCCIKESISPLWAISALQVV